MHDSPYAIARFLCDSYLLPMFCKHDIDSEHVLVCLTGSQSSRDHINGIVDICILPSRHESTTRWKTFTRELEDFKPSPNLPVRAWAFPLGRRFLASEWGDFSLPLPRLHDLAHIVRYKVIHDPSNRLKTWVQQLQHLDPIICSDLCVTLEQRIFHTPNTDKTQPLLYWYTQRRQSLKDGYLPPPITQVTHLQKNIYRKKGYPPHHLKEIDMPTAYNSIEKWATKLLPRALSKGRDNASQIMLSHLWAAALYMKDHGIHIPFFSYETEYLVWANQLLECWQPLLKQMNKVPEWVVPME